MTASTQQPAPAPRPTTQVTIGCFFIPLLVAIVLGGIFLNFKASAAPQVIVPDRNVLLVRTAPNESAPLLARFGEGQVVKVTGRTENWLWLEVKLWDGRLGWALRPLDILVWEIVAEPTIPHPPAETPQPLEPVEKVMLNIPATTFTMGSPPGLGGTDEQPAHPVSLSSFEIDRAEVTVGQYWQCVIDRVCAAPSRYASQTKAHYLNDPAFDNHPAINIPWKEANNYCLWHGKRLPTEAEWEMAAGWNAEKQAKFLWPWGNAEPPGEVNVGPASRGDAKTVGRFPADTSPVRALDMAGNVSEWVFDWYKVDYYSVADDTDPIGPTNRRGEGTGRVVRGGSFAGTLGDARTANRSHQSIEYGFNTVGFRCARDS